MAFFHQRTSFFKGQLSVPLTVYPWYLWCSLGILGDYNPYIPTTKGLYNAYVGTSHRGPTLGSGYICAYPLTFLILPEQGTHRGNPERFLLEGVPFSINALWTKVLTSPPKSIINKMPSLLNHFHNSSNFLKLFIFRAQRHPWTSKGLLLMVSETPGLLLLLMYLLDIAKFLQALFTLLLAWRLWRLTKNLTRIALGIVMITVSRQELQ